MVAIDGRARGGGCGEAAGRSEAITTARTARSSGVDEVVDGQAISVLAARGCRLERWGLRRRCGVVWVNGRGGKGSVGWCFVGDAELSHASVFTCQSHPRTHFSATTRIIQERMRSTLNSIIT